MLKLYSIELYDIDDKCIFDNDLISTFSISNDSFFCVDCNNNMYRFPMSVVGALRFEVV